MSISWSNPLNNLGAVDNVALANSFDFSNTGLAGLANVDSADLKFVDPFAETMSAVVGPPSPFQTDKGAEVTFDPAQIANMSGLGATGIGVNLPAGPPVRDEVAENFQNIFGRAPTANELNELRGRYGYSIEPGELEAITLGYRDVNVGYGVPKTKAVTPVYGTRMVVDPEDGITYPQQYVTGYQDESGNAVDQALVTAVDDSQWEEAPGSRFRYEMPIDQPTYSGSSGVVGKLTNQILSQGTTGSWGGEGYGSAEKSAADMALLLAAAGITDINQFGMIDKFTDVAVTPVYEQKLVNDPEYGEYMGNVIVGYTGPDGNAVDPSLVKTSYETEGGASYLAPVGKTQVYGNKATGQAINPYYDKASGNTWSGTFAGEGSTAYKVQFQPDGTPIFYSQFGGSSNDLAQIMDDPFIGAVIQGAATYIGGPIGNAALNILAGKEPDAVAKAALTSLVASEVGSLVSGSDAVVNSIGQNAANVAGRVAGSVVSGGGTEGALTALVSGGVDLAMPEITNLIPGYGDLTSGQKSFVNSIVASTLRDGNLSPADLVNAAVRAGTTAQRAAVQPTGGITNRVVDSFAETAPAFVGPISPFDGGADDMTEAGAAAFVEAKNAGASDEDAFAASDAVTGVQVNPIDAGGPNLSTTTTYDPRVNTVDSNFGDLQGAIETNAINDAIRADKLNVIQNTPNFNEAFAQARDLLGPGQTFPWFNPATGKVESKSTATAAERPDLNITSGDLAIEALNAANLATTTDASKTVGAQTDTTARIYGSAPDQSAAETARLSSLNAGLKSMENTSFLGQIYKDLNEQFRLQGVAANEYLANNPNSPITNNISTAFEAVGGLQKDVLGGAALLLNNKPLSDAIVKSADDLTKLGQSIGTGPQDAKNWNDTLDLIDKASGLEKLAVMAGRMMDGTSGLGRQVEVNLRQELPGLFLGGGGLRATLIATGLMDTAETAGNAALDAYEDAVKKGKNHNDALSDARSAGAVAGATEAAIQLTLGKVADVVAGRIGNVAGKAGSKVFGEGVVEGAQEGGAGAAVDFALGNAMDPNKYLTQAVVGTAVGKGAATATSGVDVAQSDALNQATSGATTAGSSAVDLGAVGATQPGASTVTGADLGEVGGVTPGGDVVVSGAGELGDSGAASAAETGVSVSDAQTAMGDLGLNVSDDTAVNLATKINNVATEIGSGADAGVVVGDAVTGAIDAGSNASTVVGSTVNSAITAGGDASTVVSSAVTSAVTAGANVDAVVATSVSSAIAAGASANTAVTAAADAAIAAGNDVTVASDANVTTITNATTNTTTSVNSSTGVTTSVDANNNVTTTVDAAANTTTTVDANTNTTTQTTTNSNTNTQTTVVTDTNTNTQTTVKVNTQTGDVIEQNETVVPSDWKPPVIEPPVVPAAVTPAAVVPAAAAPDVVTASNKTAVPKSLKLNFPGAQEAGGGLGLPSGINVDPASLRSRVTEGAIDPLARVKAAQAELERDLMMNQMDPRFLNVIQQRTNQQNQPQQFEKDIGALSKMLSGEPEAPANQSQYYSYGSEDSIDSILGGKAANYKEGGFVEPLKASGGAMALPLLAKSGGALGHYRGRENFKEGKHVAGDGDGQSDDIPAWLADGEFVFPADVVAALGNGSTKAGTDKLYEMMHGIRDRARSKGPKDLPPPALKSPLNYLKSSKRSTS